MHVLERPHEVQQRGVDFLAKLPLFTKCHFSTSHGLEFELLGLLAGLNELLQSWHLLSRDLGS